MPQWQDEVAPTKDEAEIIGEPKRMFQNRVDVVSQKTVTRCCPRCCQKMRQNAPALCVAFNDTYPKALIVAGLVETC